MPPKKNKRTSNRKKKQRKVRLLEKLRKNRVEVRPVSDAKKKEKMNLILKHKSEFPLKVQQMITHVALSITEPESFLNAIFGLAVFFMCGRIHKVEQRFALSKEWDGLDNEIDTEDQAELLIRLFPWILTVQSPRYVNDDWIYGNHLPIFFLTSFERTISFVPLFARLAMELDVLFDEKGDSQPIVNFKKGGLTHVGDRGSSALDQLFINMIAIEASGKEPSSEFDEECLAVFMRLRELGLVDYHSEERLMQQVSQARWGRNPALVESRLRLLIGWQPNILMNIIKNEKKYFYSYGMYWDPEPWDSPEYPYPFFFFSAILELVASNWPMELEDILRKLLIILRGPKYRGKHESNFSSRYLNTVAIFKYEKIIEAGLLHCPLELGFIFHTNDSDIIASLFNYISNWPIACQIFGTEKVQQILEDKIPRALEQQISPHDMLFAAATNPNMSLDSVYTLLLCNPTAFMPESCKSI